MPNETEIETLTGMRVDSIDEMAGAAKEMQKKGAGAVIGNARRGAKSASRNSMALARVDGSPEMTAASTFESMARSTADPCAEQRTARSACA